MPAPPELDRLQGFLSDAFRRPEPLPETPALLPGCAEHVAGNSKLTSIYRKLIKDLSLFRRLNLADGWLLPISASEHRPIIKAIASGDEQAAGRAMFDHVMDSKERTIENDLRRQSRAQQAATGAAAKTGKALRA